MRAPPPLVLATVMVALGAAACDASKPGAAPAASAAPASATSAPAAPTAAEPPPPPPDDLDVATAQAALKCPAGAKTGACGVLAAFASCAAWDPIVPSGDGRWMGRATVVENGKARDGVAMLRARRVPTAEVAPGQLAARISVVELPHDDDAFPQADRAIRALEHDDVPRRGNAAMDLLKSRTEWPESYAAKTSHGQVYAAREGGMWACQGPKRQVLVVERSGSKSSADGLYAELWPATW